MADRRDEQSRQDDVDWLYGNDSTSSARGGTPRGASPGERRDRGPGRSDPAGTHGEREDHVDPSGHPLHPVSYSYDSSSSRPSSSGRSRSRRGARTDSRRHRDPGGTRPRAAAGRRRHRPLRILRNLLVAWIIWLLVVPIIALVRSNTVDATPEGDRPDSQPGTATLLVGTDQRDNLSSSEQKKLGTGTEVGTRTDTMLILYTPPRGRSVLISLPRDSYVPIPGHGRNKLNAAYAIGGPKLLMATVEGATGLRMDGYMEIGFAGFVDMVDAVGGVRVCLQRPMVDKDSHTNLPAGCQTLHGIEALGYVRMRKADPLGDLGRVKRQQQITAAVAKKVISPWTAINPVRYWRVNMAVAESFRRSSDTSLWTTVRTATGLMGAAGSNGIKITVPVASTDATTAAGSSVLWDRPKALALFEALARGDTSVAEQYA
ncbi:LCP family protein [Acidipropionibacterium jensenii]|uniref:LCP family protein n=1 Tax=Acidipropionibacterium jensenii TaxID=1749 RepID=UPI003F50E8F5